MNSACAPAANALRWQRYGKQKHLNPVADLETVMAMTAAIVTEHLPGYRGRISLEFCQLAYPDDPRARFRGNVFVEAAVGGRAGPTVSTD